MTTEEIEQEISRLLVLEGKAKARLSRLSAQIGSLKHDRQMIRDSEKMAAQREAEKFRRRVREQDRLEREAEQARLDAAYDTEPAILARLRDATEGRGFTLSPKLDGNGGTIGLRVFMPYEDPTVDLLEKWGYPPTLRGAADFFQVLTRPNQRAA